MKCPIKFCQQRGIKKMSSNQPKWIKVRVPSTEILDEINIKIISKSCRLQQLATNIVIFVISGEFLKLISFLNLVLHYLTILSFSQMFTF